MSEKRPEQDATPRSGETPAIAREAEHLDAIMHAPPNPNEPKSGPSDASDEALARQEIKLSLETEKRMRDVKAEGAKDDTEKGQPEKPLNPDG